MRPRERSMLRALERSGTRGTTGRETRTTAPSGAIPLREEKAGNDRASFGPVFLPARIVGLSAILALAVHPSPALPQPVPPLRVVSSGEPRFPLESMGQPIPLDSARPVGSVGVLRSLRAPVALHVGRGVSTTTATTALGIAERAIDGLEWRYHLDGPFPDGDHGGGPELDLYLTLDGPRAEARVDALVASALWDRASAWCRVRAAPELRLAVTEAVARAVILGTKVDHPPAFVAAAASAMAREIVGSSPDPVAVRAFQRHPERSMLGGWDRDDTEGRGAGVFFDWLSARHDTPLHPAVLAGLVAGPAHHTPLGSSRFDAEPDLFDVARRVFRDEERGLPGALLDFACTRSMLGTSGDPDDAMGTDDPSAVALPLRVWRYDQLPGWVMARGIEPTGMATFTVDLSEAPPRPVVGVWFHATPWHRWRAALLRIDPRGRLIGRIESEEITNGEWSTRLEVLNGVNRVVAVLVNLGALDLDPDAPQPATGFAAMHAASLGAVLR